MSSRSLLIFGFLVLVSFQALIARQGSTVIYELTHRVNSPSVEVTIKIPVSQNTIELIIPRSAPGTYEMTDYSIFFQKVKAASSNGETIIGQKGIGSYFTLESASGGMRKVTYEVDIKRMEDELYGSFATSKSRDNYLGLLGYSAFGFVSGFEDKEIELLVKTEADWPIFSTLNPSLDRKKGDSNYKAANFGHLADAQFLLGKDLKLWSSTEGPTPLFVAVYSETTVNMEEIGRRAMISLRGLNDYFGFTPMPFYTLCYEFVKPLSPQHDYGFSMEHMNSMTASLDTSSAVKKYIANPRMGSMVHHMGHSWIPLRSYGKGYRPFNWGTAPVIETIWLNEGFTWFIAFHEVLGFKAILDRFNNIMHEAPPYIKKMPLKDLSILGSSQYSADFRVGQNLFARGALMAWEIDKEIRKKTNGEKTFQNAVLGLYEWSQKNQKAFEYEDIPKIMSAAADTDLSEIWRKWQIEPASWRNKN